MNFKKERYDTMQYRRCGRSGLKLPAISLGLWHNFGEKANHENCRDMLRTAFDLGITHFDLANNYGPAGGSAETRAGQILKEDFRNHRDELIISTKAGYLMWPGPYGDWGSKKYLTASLDQSLQRLGLDYVDIFYSHRPDPDTPLEETLGALDLLVQQGKVLYAGVSNYRGAYFVRAAETVKACRYAPITIHQPNYSLLDRWVEHDLLEHTERYGTGTIVFCPLQQGLLTDKYLDANNPIPVDSRASDPDGFLQKEGVTEAIIAKVRNLAALAKARGQSTAQTALAWVLRDPRITSALIGARNAQQIRECVGALENLDFSEEELALLDDTF